MRENKYQSRLNDFRKEIRKNQIQKIKNELRNAVEFDFTTEKDLAIILKLDPSRQYKLQEIIFFREKQLSSPPLKSHQLRDETDLHIEAHIRFWKYYSQHLQLDKTLLCDRIISILANIIQAYKYYEIHHNVVYQLHLLNTFQIACRQFESPLRDKLLLWLAGPEGLRVIHACVQSDEEGSFTNCFQYEKVFKLIELGLKSEMRQENEDAAQLLAKILGSSDWDDTLRIYQKFHGIMIYLCNIAERYSKDGITRIYTYAVLLLLDGYDTTVLDYARAGVAFTAAKLLYSAQQATCLEALEILRVLSQVNSSQMTALLLQNYDIDKTKFWGRLLSREFAASRNLRLRTCFYSFLENTLAHCTKSQVDEINNKFGGDYEDIFDLLAECLRNEESGVIQKSVLSCITSLAFYGQCEGENLLMPTLQRRGIIKNIMNLSGGEGEVSVEAWQVLDNLKAL